MLRIFVTAHGNHALDKAAGTEGSLRSRLLLFILFKATLHIRTPWHQGEQFLGMLAEVHGRQIGQANVQIRFRRQIIGLGRTDRSKPAVLKTAPTNFHFGEVAAYYDNPVSQAEYLYSLIESEER